MTIREFLTNVSNGIVTDAEMEIARKEIAKMDAANEKRKNKPSKTAVENEPIKASILAVLTNDPQPASDIAALVEITPQKASALLRQLATAGAVAVSEIKVPKKGEVNGYTAVVVEAEVEAEAAVAED